MRSVRNWIRVWRWTPLYLALLFVLGWFSEQQAYRHDTTQDKIYTLNENSKRLVAQLKEPLTIKLFFSKDYPPKFKPIFDFVNSMLAEYQAAGAGKVRLQYIDPGTNLELNEIAKTLGIEPTKANISEKDRLEMIQIWFGMALFYADKQEVFPAVGELGDFEFDVSSAILRLTREQLPKIAFVGPTYDMGGGQYVFDLAVTMDRLNHELKKHFRTEQWSLTSGLDLRDADLLCAWGLDYLDNEQFYAVDQFLLSGRPALILTPGTYVDPLTYESRARSLSAADSFFAKYGFSVDRNLINDSSCMKIRFQNQQPVVLKPYSLFPLLTHSNQGLSNWEPLKALSSLMLPYASSLKRLNEDDTRLQVVLKSSPQAWHQDDESFQIDPNLVGGPTFFEQYELGLLFQGPQEKFINPPAGSDTAFEKGRHVRALFVGSEHLLVQAANTNGSAFFTNLFSYFGDGGLLSGIDRREYAFNPVKPLTYEEKQVVKWRSLWMGPFLLLVFGIAKMTTRRMRNPKPYLL